MHGLRRPSELENMPDFLFENTIIISDPREENCYLTIKEYCCPYFTLSSFTAIISLIEIVIFILMCIYGNFNLSGTVMQFSDETLDIFGNCSAFMVKYKLEYYRLFTSLFIFNNIKDLCGGILAQLIIVSMSEKFVNRFNACLIYFSTGIGGTIAFIVFYDQEIEGNTFCIFGMIGSICGFVIQNAQYEDARQVILQMAIFIVLIGIIGFFYKNSYIFGFYGSFILGIIIGLILPILQRQFQRTKMKLVGLGIIFMYFTGFIYIFFSYREPTMPIKQH